MLLLPPARPDVRPPGVLPNRSSLWEGRWCDERGVIPQIGSHRRLAAGALDALKIIRPEDTTALVPVPLTAPSLVLY